LWGKRESELLDHDGVVRRGYAWTHFEKEQNYPNPFNPSTAFRFTLPEAAHVTLSIYDVLGREVVRLVDAVKEVGVHTITWNAAQMPSGVYFYQLQAGDFKQSRQMLLMK